jgi:uncharacterized protein (DUF58 family)
MTLRPRILLLIVLIALIGVLGTWSGEPLEGAWRWLAAILIALLVVEYLDANSYPLRCLCEHSPRLRLGVATRARFLLVNEGGRSCDVRFRPVPPVALTLQADDCRTTVAAQGSADLSFTVAATELGRHRWPLQPVSIQGALGLADWIRRLPLDLESRSVPDAYGAGNVGTTTARGGSRADARVRGSGSEFRGLRSYVPGDPPGIIDWKSTARRGTVLVRESEAEQHLEIVVVLDAGRGSRLSFGELSALGHAANVTARLAVLAEQCDDRCGLLVFADRVLARLPTGNGPAHLQRLVRLLAQLDAQPAESNPILAVTALRHLVRQRALVVMFANLDDPDASGQLIRATRLLRPTHLPLIVAIRDAEIDALAAQPAATWIDPYSSLAAIEYRRQVRATRERLQRLGAEIIEAPPERLDTLVLDRYQSLRRARRV